MGGGGVTVVYFVCLILQIFSGFSRIFNRLQVAQIVCLNCMAHRFYFCQTCIFSFVIATGFVIAFLYLICLRVSHGLLSVTVVICMFS